MSLLWHTLLSPLVYAWVGGFTLLGIGLLALWWFTPAFLSSPDRRVILLVAGIACFFLGGFYTKAFVAGERHIIQRLAAQDRAAWERVEEGTKEVDACNGGVDWDVTTGTCVPGSGANAQ